MCLPVADEAIVRPVVAFRAGTADAVCHRLRRFGQSIQVQCREAFRPLERSVIADPTTRARTTPRDAKPLRTLAGIAVAACCKNRREWI